MNQIHGSCVSLEGVGVVLRGPPGVGKSDLALRLIDGGASLVADDRITLQRDTHELCAMAPDSLRGLLEVRGLGIVRLAAQHSVAVGLVVDLENTPPAERLPQHTHCQILGMNLPCLTLSAQQASAVAKIRLAVSLASGRITRVETTVTP